MWSVERGRSSCLKKWETVTESPHTISTSPLPQTHTIVPVKCTRLTTEKKQSSCCSDLCYSHRSHLTGQRVLQGYCCEALRHTAMRSENIMVWVLQTYWHEVENTLIWVLKTYHCGSLRQYRVWTWRETEPRVRIKSLSHKIQTGKKSALDGIGRDETGQWRDQQEMPYLRLTVVPSLGASHYVHPTMCIISSI